MAFAFVFLEAWLTTPGCLPKRLHQNPMNPVMADLSPSLGGSSELTLAPRVLFCPGLGPTSAAACLVYPRLVDVTSRSSELPSRAVRSQLSRKATIAVGASPHQHLCWGNTAYFGGSRHYSGGLIRPRDSGGGAVIPHDGDRRYCCGLLFHPSVIGDFGFRRWQVGSLSRFANGVPPSGGGASLCRQGVEVRQIK